MNKLKKITLISLFGWVCVFFCLACESDNTITQSVNNFSPCFVQNSFQIDNPNGEKNDRFGESVAFGSFDNELGLDLLIGSGHSSVMDLNRAGRAQIFFSSGEDDFATSLERTQPPLGPKANAHFGSQVATGDFNNDGFDDLAVRADGDDRIYTYLSDGMGDFAIPQAILLPMLFDFSYLHNKLILADFNNDNFDDIVAGSPQADLTEGKVRVVLTDGTGDHASTITLKEDDPELEAFFGLGVVSGDFNNDGQMDLAVGAPKATVDGVENAGEVHIFINDGMGGFAVSEILQEPSPDASFEFGRTLASGDFNGDGVDDLAVGAPRAPLTSLIDKSSVYIFLSNEDGSFDLGPNFINSLGQQLLSSAFFGYDLEAGDVNGDGVDDIVVGAPNMLGLAEITGGAGYVGILFMDQFGSGSIASQLLIWNPQGQKREQFGHSLSLADSNSDGFLDVLIGSPDFNENAILKTGRSYLYQLGCF